MRRHDIGSDAGFSLVEIVITIAIVGVTFTAILGGLFASITVSALQHKEATADTLARSAAESVKVTVKDNGQSSYTNCATPGDYTALLTSVTVPTGFSVTITDVAYWDGQPPAGGAVVFQSNCPSDKGIQRITIAATSSDGQATETVQVLKRLGT